jgi:hypothetical protein
VALAARGSRQLGDEIEKIDDPAELAQVKWQARRVRLKAVVAGLLMTGIALALPEAGN